MNEKRKMLLKKAILSNNGKVTMNMANSLYSGNGGKDAVQSMEFQGYLENIAPGVFKILKVPHDIKEEVEAAKKGKIDK